MRDKQNLIAGLRAVYEDWERLLTAGDGEGIAARRVTSKWTVKDVIAHLTAWQQISVARLQAALAGGDPELPPWLEGADPFHAEEHTPEFNARIHARYGGEAWPAVYRAWREGFTRFLGLADAIPEGVLLDPQRFAWLRGHALSAVLEGSREHHREHLDATSRALRTPDGADP
jgi:hypothetical protein